MPAMTIRGLTEETYVALKALAAETGTNAEALARDTLTELVMPSEKVGDLMLRMARETRVVELDIKRDKELPREVNFG